MARWIILVASGLCLSASVPLRVTLNRTSCHSVQLSKLGWWYSCKELPEPQGRIWEQEREHFWCGPEMLQAKMWPQPALSLRDVCLPVRETESEDECGGSIKNPDNGMWTEPDNLFHTFDKLSDWNQPHDFDLKTHLINPNTLIWQ